MGKITEIAQCGYLPSNEDISYIETGPKCGIAEDCLESMGNADSPIRNM
jgi:hypothetical protein